MTMRERLTEKLASTLPAPAAGNVVYWDAPPATGKDYVAGFGLRVTAAGARAFILNYRTRSGRERRLTIGAWPAWTVTAARAEAASLKRRIDAGDDPLADRQELRDAPTVSELLDRFQVEHVAKKRRATQRSYQASIYEIRKEFGTRKVAEVTHDDIERLHRRITERGAPYSANRMLAVASKAFAMAIRSGWRADSPTRGIERNDEEKRQRYLSPAEVARLTATLVEYKDRQAADIIMLLLLTGARSGEVLSMRWRDVDLEQGIWIKPSSHTKQRKEHRVELSEEAVKLLRRIRDSADPDEVYVFPGRAGHRAQVRNNNWAEICRAADIKGARVHDLRHTHASLLVSAGFSLPIIGAMLGHSLPSTTARYAHLQSDPLRVAANVVGKLVAGKKPGKVVPIRGR
jgi:integrase